MPETRSKRRAPDGTTSQSQELTESGTMGTQTAKDASESTAQRPAKVARKRGARKGSVAATPPSATTAGQVTGASAPVAGGSGTNVSLMWANFVPCDAAQPGLPVATAGASAMPPQAQGAGALPTPPPTGAPHAGLPPSALADPNNAVAAALAAAVGVGGARLTALSALQAATRLAPSVGVSGQPGQQLPLQAQQLLPQQMQQVLVRQGLAAGGPSLASAGITTLQAAVLQQLLAGCSARPMQPQPHPALAGPSSMAPAAAAVPARAMQPIPVQQQQPRPSPAAADPGTGPRLPKWSEESLRLVDPFWRPLEVLAAFETAASSVVPGSHGQLQSHTLQFFINSGQLEKLQDKASYQLRAVCVMPDDAQFWRCHWYAGSQALCNGKEVVLTGEDRVSVMLPLNQADQPADISPHIGKGNNRFMFMWPVNVCGAVVALRLCQRVSRQQLAQQLKPPLPLDLVLAQLSGSSCTPTPPPAPAPVAEPAEAGASDATSGSGAAADPKAAEKEAEAAADDAIEAGPVTVALRCPLGGGRIRVPAWFTNCGSVLAFFELDIFLQLAETTGSWLCPATGKLCNPDNLRMHTYINGIVRTLAHNKVLDDVEEVEVHTCGRWRPKNSRVPLLEPVDGTAPAGGALPSFDPQLLKPENAHKVDVVDLTNDDVIWL